MATASTRPATHSDTDPIPTAEPEILNDLIAQVADLRERVSKLEERLGAPAAAPEAPLTRPVLDITPITRPEIPTGIVPVLGRMLVAIAGAYVLRALTEFGTLPPAAGVSVGILYGLVWLVVAARLPMEAKFAAAMNGATSVLIIAPLVWEATQRLKVMSSASGAAVIVAYALIGSALAAKTGHRAIGTIAAASSITLAMVLLFARDDIVPFTAALLVIALAHEFGAWRDVRPGARGFAAVAADGTVLLFTALMARTHGLPPTWVPVSMYAVLAAQVGLALIYVTTAVIQTVARRRTLGFGEMIQTATALLIGIGGAVWIYRDNRPIMLGLGIVALAGGIACYAVSFTMFESDNKWNFRAWATFGLFLATAGISLPFSRTGFWLLCCGCALVCCWTARTFHLPTLGLHGAVYLAMGSAAAGATIMPFQVLFDGGGAVEWRMPIVVLAVALAAWIPVLGMPAHGGGHWRNQISSLGIVGHIAWILVGLKAYGALALWRMAMGGNGGPGDTLGTMILTALSLLLAWAGTRWDRHELVWLLYGVMSVGAYKLVVRDFANEHSLALVVSLLCYGGALIVLPGMLRGRFGTRAT
jgi:hypothetical protein